MEIRQKAKERGMADEELRGRESRQRPPREITVSEAAAALRVSERTVLNFIKEKRIKAVKVGKKWFVDAQSVRDLAYGGGRSGVMPPFGGEFSVKITKYGNFRKRHQRLHPATGAGESRAPHPELLLFGGRSFFEAHMANLHPRNRGVGTHRSRDFA
jgi:excisionase family DNA binding protein